MEHLQAPVIVAIQQVLAIPQKRFDRAIVSFLTLAELNALVASPDRTNWKVGVTTPC